MKIFEVFCLLVVFGVFLNILIILEVFKGGFGHFIGLGYFNHFESFDGILFISKILKIFLSF